MTSTIPLSIVAAAQAAQRKWGVYASVTCAQWALESAWGAHMSGKNNPFGIKAKAGEACTACTTWEVIGGTRRTMVQNFRDYPTLKDAFDAHGQLLMQGGAYALAREFIGKRSADGFANALTGHYATDPQYGAKLISIMRAHGLYAYDAGGMVVPNTPVASAAPVVASPGALTTGAHITGLAPTAKPGFWATLLAGIRGKAA